ncbi:hypothetical protein PAMP_018270 [Pampus punctatissimus]
MNVFDPNSITLQLHTEGTEVSIAFCTRFLTFQAREYRIFRWKSIHSWLPLSANCRECVQYTWTCLPSAGSYICSIPSDWSSDWERWIDPWEMWDERNVNRALQDPSCHNSKDTNTPRLNAQRDVKTVGGETLSVWLFEVSDKSFQSKKCYDIPHEYVTFSTEH